MVLRGLIGNGLDHQLMVGYKRERAKCDEEERYVLSSIHMLVNREPYRECLMGRKQINEGVLVRIIYISCHWLFKSCYVIVVLYNSRIFKKNISKPNINPKLDRIKYW